MSIKIIEQDYDNECGICALATMHNYFYPKDIINKSSLIEISNLTDKGLNLYDLEVIGNKINLNIETYELNISEFYDLNYYEYFITFVSGNGMNHFVICKRDKSNILLYDFDGRKYIYTYEEFKNIYNNIFIKVQKKIVKDFNIDLYKYNKKIFFEYPNNYFFISIVIFVEIFSMFLNMISNGFIKILIDKIIPLQMINELIYIALFFIVINLMNFIFFYLLNIWKMNKYESIFKNHIHLYTFFLKNKNKIFFEKFSKEIICEYPNAISHLIIKKYFLIPSLIADIFICIFLVSIIFINSYIFIFPFLINAFFIVIFGLIKLKNNNKNYNALNINKNKIEISYKNFYDFIINEKDSNKLNSLEENWHKELWEFNKINKISNIFNSTIDLFDNSISKFIFISFASLFSYSIVTTLNNQKITISNLIFLTSILTMLTSTFNDIFSFVCSIPLYKKSNRILNDFVSIHNIQFNEYGLSINNVEKIMFNNLNFSYKDEKIIFKNFNKTFSNGDLLIGRNGVGKTTLFKIISMDYLDNNQLEKSYLINDLELSKINLQKMFNNIIYIPSNSQNIKINFENLLNNKDKEIRDFTYNLISKLKINFSDDKHSKGEQQIINAISLLDYKNKIILFDESFSNINEQYYEIVYKDIKNFLEKNNFVLWISHNKKIFKYFKRKVSISK